MEVHDNILSYMENIRIEFLVNPEDPISSDSVVFKRHF